MEVYLSLDWPVQFFLFYKTAEGQEPTIFTTMSLVLVAVLSLFDSSLDQIKISVPHALITPSFIDDETIHLAFVN